MSLSDSNIQLQEEIIGSFWIWYRKIFGRNHARLSPGKPSSVDPGLVAAIQLREVSTVGDLPQIPLLGHVLSLSVHKARIYPVGFCAQVAGFCARSDMNVLEIHILVS